MATYTVTNTFVADTSAVAAQVNQNFTDILAAINAFDASNLLSGTIPLARIAGLTTTQFAANVIDTDGTLAANSDTRIASQKAGKTYTDTQITAIAPQASGVTVFSGPMTAVNTFQDLDLSGTVGANFTLVHLEVNLGSSNKVYAAKPKGFGSATFSEHHHNDFACGGTVGRSAVTATFLYITLFTDSSGVIQHGFSDNTTTITIKLVGYIGP